MKWGFWWLSPLTSQRVFPPMLYAAERRLEAAVTKSNVSSSSLSNEIVSSPACNRAARRFVLCQSALVSCCWFLGLYLEINNSKLSCKVKVFWSLSPAPAVLVDALCPFWLLTGTDVSLDVIALAGLPRRMKDPFLIPSNDSGIGGALVFHMSPIERRFNISE